MDAPNKQFNDKELLDALCLWINDNVNQSISWNDLTKQSNLSHSELIRLFRKIDSSPMTYVRTVKEKEMNRKRNEVGMQRIKESEKLIPTSLLKKIS